MKRLFLIPCFLLFLSSTQAQGLTPHLKVKYDKFEDSTVVMLWDMPLAQGVIGWMPEPLGDHPRTINLTIVDSYTGQRRKDGVRDEDPAYVRLSSDRSIGLVSTPDLTLLIDGERIKIKTVWDTNYKGQINDKSVKLPINYGLLRRLTAAKQVEGKLGSSEFHFTSRNKDEIRAFIRVISLPSSTILK